jgi:1-acyl-sn-glycerol-3-phosphate acyltransferase
MFSFLVSVYTLLFVLVSFICLMPVAAIIWAVTILFDPKLKFLHKFTSVWGVSFIAINPFLKIKITGKENIKKGETYVMICNHQSLLDIIVLFKLFTHFKWVSKKELFKIPVVGWTMYLNRYIAVDRANKHSHAKMFEACNKNLLMGNSLLIFPEGTRSEDGNVHFFKEGAFKMALNAKKGILPIVLDGTAAAIPKKGLMFKSLAHIQIKILPPVSYDSIADFSPKQLSVKFQDLITSELNSLKANR